MKEELIKNFKGVPIGIIVRESNGDEIAKAFPTRQPLGYYRVRQDITTDFFGRQLSKGNTVISLIYNYEKDNH